MIGVEVRDEHTQITRNMTTTTVSNSAYGNHIAAESPKSALFSPRSFVLLITSLFNSISFGAPIQVEKTALQRTYQVSHRKRDAIAPNVG